MSRRGWLRDRLVRMQTAETFGTGVVPLLPAAIRRARLLAWQGIDVVIDVGANAGQYGRSVREGGYDGRIVSFEPLSAAFEQLASATSDDGRWECRQLALEVLAGAHGLLPQVVAVEAELSLVPLYRDGPLYRDVIEALASRGFDLVSIEGITEEPETGHMLQLDGVFVRRDSD